MERIARITLIPLNLLQTIPQKLTNNTENTKAAAKAYELMDKFDSDTEYKLMDEFDSDYENKIAFDNKQMQEFDATDRYNDFIMKMS